MEDPPPQHPSPPSDEDPQTWLHGAVARLGAVWHERGAAYRRHLARQALPADPLEDVLTLAARRELPLEPPRHRLLPRRGLCPRARALSRLVRPDRLVLRQALAGELDEDSRLDHAAAALLRLALNERAARRRTDAPPVESAPPGGGACAT